MGWQQSVILQSCTLHNIFDSQCGLGAEFAHHVITRQQLLQELGLLVLHRLDDELVVAGEVEPGAAGSGVGQLNQGLVADGVLKCRARLLAGASLATPSRAEPSPAELKRSDLARSPDSHPV